jgi:hypothetical protein
MANPSTVCASKDAATDGICEAIAGSFHGSSSTATGQRHSRVHREAGGRLRPTILSLDNMSESGQRHGKEQLTSEVLNSKIENPCSRDKCHAEAPTKPCNDFGF